MGYKQGCGEMIWGCNSILLSYYPNHVKLGKHEGQEEQEEDVNIKEEFQN